MSFHLISADETMVLSCFTLHTKLSIAVFAQSIPHLCRFLFRFLISCEGYLPNHHGSMHTMTTLTTTLAPTISGNSVATTTVITSDLCHQHYTLSPGASAGIGIASLFIVCTAIVALVWLCRGAGNRRRFRSKGNPEEGRVL